MQKLGGPISTSAKPLNGRKDKFGALLDPSKYPATSRKSLLGAINNRMGAENADEAPVVGAVNPKKGNMTYIGKISPLNYSENSEIVAKILKESNLFYLGDGVKLPLSIKPLGDGSYGLSITDNICKTFLKRECPCHVPQSGSVIQEFEVTSEEPQLRKQRSLRRKRSVVMPVEDFAKKYNLKLNLAEKMDLMIKEGTN